MTLIICMMYALFIVLLFCIAISQIPKEKLRFRTDGTFSILQLTDLHYGEGDVPDMTTTKIMRTLIEVENPDFLSFTGDMVAGYGYNGTAGWYEAMWKRWTSIILEKKIPYGYTLGNHDSEADLKRIPIMKLDMTNPYSYSSTSPEGVPGASNFVIPIYSSKDVNVVVMNLWFFDSGDYNCLGVKGYGCVDLETVQWYRRHSRELEVEQGGKKPGVAFMHIPPPEYLFGYNHYYSWGNKTEDGGCSSMDTGLIAAFKERGDVIAMFAGHDHSNDYVNDFEGIILGYGRKTGKGCYGPPEGMQRGGRMLKFSEEHFKMDTWIIQEDGTREIQKPSVVQIPPQDVCNGSKPPRK